MTLRGRETRLCCFGCLSLGLTGLVIWKGIKDGLSDGLGFLVFLLFSHQYQKRGLRAPPIYNIITFLLIHSLLITPVS